MFGQSEMRTGMFGQSEMRTGMFGQSEMRAGAVMGQRPPRKSLFEDDADDPPSGYPTPEPDCAETKYSQINKNLQNIISFCTNKLGTIQNQSEVPQGELEHCKAQQQQIFEGGFPDSIVEGDAGMASARFSYRSDAGQVPQKMRFRSPDSYVKCQQEKQRDTNGVESQFIPGGRARSVPASFAQRLQAVEQEAAARKIAVRRWIRPQSPEVPAGPGPLLTKLRNLTGSPIIPLDCPKCQLEISKRELETMRRNLYRAQGLHHCQMDCCGCGCGGDEEPTGLAEWACTCGVGRQRGRRDLHREKGRDLALATPVRIPVGLGHSNRFNGCLRSCSFSATPVSLHCPGNNGCCHHSDVIHNVVPNFVHHEDTHGKCRDCHRQDMLHDALKLKNSLDMQYEQQRTTSLHRHYESGTKCCTGNGNGSGGCGNTCWTGSDDGRWTTKAEMPRATVRKVTEIGDCAEKSGRTAGGRSEDEDGGSGNGGESGNGSDSGGHKSRYLDTTRSSDPDLDRSCCSGESVRSNTEFAYFEERIGPYPSNSVPSIDE